MGHDFLAPANELKLPENQQIFMSKKDIFAAKAAINKEKRVKFDCWIKKADPTLMYCLSANRGWRDARNVPSLSLPLSRVPVTLNCIAINIARLSLIRCLDKVSSIQAHWMVFVCIVWMNAFVLIHSTVRSHSFLLLHYFSIFRIQFPLNSP